MKKGYTLIELVAALSISAVLGSFAAGFLFHQTHQYRSFCIRAEAGNLGTLVYMRLEKKLRYAREFYVNSQEPEQIFYRMVPEDDGGDMWTALNPDEICGDIPEGFDIVVDFSGTKPLRAEAVLCIYFGEQPVYQQEYVINSLYEDQESGGAG